MSILIDFEAQRSTNQSAGGPAMRQGHPPLEEIMLTDLEILRP